MKCSLYHLDEASDYVVSDVSLKGLLNSLGIREGVMVRAISRQPFGGPVVIKVGDRCVALAKEVASQIQVERVYVEKEIPSSELVACG